MFKKLATIRQVRAVHAERAQASASNSSYSNDNRQGFRRAADQRSRVPRDEADPRPPGSYESYRRHAQRAA
jgi:hypothetical protein